MPNCPECNAEVLIGEAFCSECGRSLADLSAPPQEAPTPAPPPADAGDAPPPPPLAGETPPPAPAAPAAAGEEIQCPSCGASNPHGSNFCESCGSKLASAPAAGTEAAPDAARLIVKSSGAELPLPGKDQVLIGRADPSTGWAPDIDLAPHGGTADAGVSRRHCIISRQGDGWLIQDQGAVNPCKIETQGRQLALNESAPLNDGDEFTVGNLTLVFHAS